MSYHSLQSGPSQNRSIETHAVSTTNRLTHSLTHSLTAAFDQLRVVASSTSNDPGPRSRQHQQIGQCLLLTDRAVKQRVFYLAANHCVFFTARCSARLGLCCQTISVCLYVCLSVTRWYSAKTSKRSIKLFSPLGKHTILVFSTKRHGKQ